MPTTVFIMVDGLRPDALAAARLPNINGLRARGAATLRASSVMPSITIPCLMSIFHSIPPSRHGVMKNDDLSSSVARPLPVPGLVDQAKAANLNSAFFHHWEPLRNLNITGSLAFSYYRDNCYIQYPDADQVIADEAARYIASDRPDFAFVYLGMVDVAGHHYGWMSDGYLKQVERTDKAVGTVLNGIAGDSTVLLQSDHGGHDRSHGSAAPEDMTIPWLVAGPGIRAGYEIETPVSLLDTAPTLAAILGIPSHEGWEGRCVAEIFENDRYM